MIFNRYRLMLCLCWLSFVFPSYANNLYQQAMVRLDRTAANNNGIETLEQYRGKPMLMSFFMPNCKWCQKQHKALKKIQEHCPDTHIIMLGVKGNYQRLKHELRKEHNQFPAYVANTTIVNAIGKNTPVPMTLVVDHQGGVAFKTTGYTPIKKFEQLLTESHIVSCQQILTY